MHEDAVNSVLLGHLQQSVEMLLPRMHATVRHQPEQMQLASSQPGILHRVEQHWVREEFAVLDHQVDARDFHMHDAPGANIQMADFTVPHLPFRQPDKRPAGMNQSVGILAQQPVIRRLAREGDGVGLGFGSIPPAVENDENERFRTRHKRSLLAPSYWLLASDYKIGTLRYGHAEKMGER